MEPRPDIDDNDYNEWMAANPEAEHSVVKKYCELMTAMPDEDEDDEEVSRLALRHVMPLSLYKPPKDLLFPGVIGFELLVKFALDFVHKIVARSDVLPQQRQSLVAVHKALARLPQKKPEGEYSVAITYTPRAQGHGMLRHYFSLELSPDCLQLATGEFDEMNDHNGMFSFELYADGEFSESGYVGFWAEGIEQAADSAYEVNVSAELPDVASPPQSGPAASPPDPTEDEHPSPPMPLVVPLQGPAITLKSAFLNLAWQVTEGKISREEADRRIERFKSDVRLECEKQKCAAKSQVEEEKACPLPVVALPKPKPAGYSGPRDLTPQEIKSLRRDVQAAQKSNQAFLAKRFPRK